MYHSDVLQFRLIGVVKGLDSVDFHFMRMPNALFTRALQSVVIVLQGGVQIVIVFM